jgi:hypothetical protein
VKQAQAINSAAQIRIGKLYPESLTAKKSYRVMV